MKRKFSIAAGTLALVVAGIAAGVIFPLPTAPTASAQEAATSTATEQTTVFAIANMTCALCPVTVKTAMEGVEGVRSVQIDFETKTAVVLFDPSITTVEEIAISSTNAGYPASPAS